MKNITIGLVIGSSLLVASCGRSDPCSEAKDPTECRAYSQAGGSSSDYLLYGMAGYMLATTMQGGQQVTVIRENPSYRGTRPNLSKPIPSEKKQIANKREQAKQKKLRDKKAAADRKKRANNKASSRRSSTRRSSRRRR